LSEILDTSGVFSLDFTDTDNSSSWENSQGITENRYNNAASDVTGVFDIPGIHRSVKH